MVDSFIFYRSFSEALSELTDEQAGKFIKLLSNYALDSVEPEKLEGLIKIMFCLVKPQIDANSKRRDSSKVGGAPPNNQNAKKQPTVDLPKNEKQPTVDFANDKKQPNVNVNVNDNVNGNIPAKPEEPPDGVPSPPVQPPALPQTPAEAEHLSCLLRDLHQKNDPKYHPSPHNMRSWAHDIDKIHRIDGREWDEIERVIRWAKSDGFWVSNIMSGLKLREKFPTLYAQMTRPRSPPEADIRSKNYVLQNDRKKIDISGIEIIRGTG